MDFELSGRTALVTGASQGIGRGVARLLALQGVRVVGVARRVELVEKLSHEVEREGGQRIEPLRLDLQQDGAPERAADEATRRVGPIDILMNVAGQSRPLPFDAPQSAWEDGMLLNFYTVRRLAHALVPAMRSRRWGRIINFTGTSEPRMLNAAFTAKAAVHVWAKGLSREVAADGVTVNCLAPGRIRSEQISRRYPTPEAEREYAEAEIPARRFGEPAEIAAVAAFLASPMASYVTGTVIAVDGGSSRFAF
jgi:3-oxoacyl-[acyl-carrier protein] reductase